jgi:hypothetical protein
MAQRDSNQRWQKLVDEHLAARAALDRANTTIVVLTETAGVPIEHLDVECIAESRARADLARVRRQMEQFDSDDAEALPIG